MTLHELMSVYKGYALLTIWGYYEKMRYDYYTMPDKDVEDFKGNNPKNYIPSCLERQEWYQSVRDKTVKEIRVISDGPCKVELCIELNEES